MIRESIQETSMFQVGDKIRIVSRGEYVPYSYSVEHSIGIITRLDPKNSFGETLVIKFIRFGRTTKANEVFNINPKYCEVITSDFVGPVHKHDKLLKKIKQLKEKHV